MGKLEQYYEMKYSELLRIYNRDMKLQTNYIKELKESIHKENKVRVKDKEIKKSITELNVNLMKETLNLK